MQKIIANQTDIDKLLSVLRECKGDSPEFEASGTNNWKEFDAMIEMVETKNTDYKSILAKYDITNHPAERELISIMDFLTGVITIEVLLEHFSID